MLYNLFVTKAKTIRVATSVGLGLVLAGDLACRSADKFEKTEPATVQPVTDVEPPAGVEPIRLEDVGPLGVGTRQLVIEDDVLNICEVRDIFKLPAGKYRLFENGHWKPFLIDGDGEPSREIIDLHPTYYNSWGYQFAKPGARFPPDIIHDRMWEDERQGLLFAPPPGK